MNIAFISPEVYPFAKTGGLADVSYALPKALAKAGHSVCIFTPRYKSVSKEKFRLSLAAAPLIVKMGPEEKYSAIFRSSYIPGVDTFFIDYEAYFGRDSLYGYNDNDFNDNAERFAFFTKAVILGLKEINFIPDIVHCNDWHTGLIPLYLKTVYSNDVFFKNCAIIMTVHNAAYQGVFAETNLDINEFTGSSFKIEKVMHQKGISYLKAGILHSDIVTTVSKKYAEEIQTQEYGYELAEVFKSIKDRLFGISNAIDTEEWNPETDSNIPANYSAGDLSGKMKCKLELQRIMGLPADPDIPLVGTISRLSYQKGMDVLAITLELLLQDESFQFVITGSGEQGIAKRFDHIKKMFPESAGIIWEYDEGLGHMIEAGLDIFIMPSRYEPCGLSQMYSLKYGTIPVVRATGGLDEIIDEWDEKEKCGNGFKFNNLVPEELYNTLRKVIKKYNDKDDWEIIQKNGMRYNSSWDNAVREYEMVYQIALKVKA